MRSSLRYQAKKPATTLPTIKASVVNFNQAFGLNSSFAFNNALLLNCQAKSYINLYECTKETLQQRGGQQRQLKERDLDRWMLLGTPAKINIGSEKASHRDNSMVSEPRRLEPAYSNEGLRREHVIVSHDFDSNLLLPELVHRFDKEQLLIATGPGLPFITYGEAFEHFKKCCWLATGGEGTLLFSLAKSSTGQKASELSVDSMTEDSEEFDHSFLLDDSRSGKILPQLVYRRLTPISEKSEVGSDQTLIATHIEQRAMTHDEAFGRFKKCYQAAGGEGNLPRLVQTENRPSPPEITLGHGGKSKPYVPLPSLDGLTSPTNASSFTDKRRPEIYVVFENANRKFITDICSQLEDQFDFVLGSKGDPNELNELIRIKIKNSQGVLICSSPSFGKSRCSLRECVLAMELDKPFVCVQLFKKRYKPASWLTSLLRVTTKSFLGISTINFQRQAEDLRKKLLNITRGDASFLLNERYKLNEQAS